MPADDQVVLQIENSSDTFFRSIDEPTLREIVFDKSLSLDEKRERLWESSEEFAVVRLSMVDCFLVLNGEEDEKSWSELEQSL